MNTIGNCKQSVCSPPQLYLSLVNHSKENLMYFNACGMKFISRSLTKKAYLLFQLACVCLYVYTHNLEQYVYEGKDFNTTESV